MRAEHFWLSDTQWAKVKPVLPPYVRGKHRVDDRRVVSGILHVLLTACRWSESPLEYGPRKTLYNRFVRWEVKGLWDKLFRELEKAGGPSAEKMISSARMKAHRAATGGRRKQRLVPGKMRGKTTDS